MKNGDHYIMHQLGPLPQCFRQGAAPMAAASAWSAQRFTNNKGRH